MVRAFGDTFPRVHPTAFIDESAQIIGDIEIGEESSVWMNAVVRGDVHWIRIGRRTNVQDGTVVHVMAGSCPMTIGHEGKIRRTVSAVEAAGIETSAANYVNYSGQYRG